MNKQDTIKLCHMGHPYLKGYVKGLCHGIFAAGVISAASWGYFGYQDYLKKHPEKPEAQVNTPMTIDSYR